VLLTRDHVIPLGEPGASDAIDNIQPLCGPCNAWKGRRALDYRAAPRHGEA
jgi:5-methylcytosine-specific restriction endonuclease McrA